MTQQCPMTTSVTSIGGKHSHSRHCCGLSPTLPWGRDTLLSRWGGGKGVSENADISPTPARHTPDFHRCTQLGGPCFCGSPRPYKASRLDLT